MKKNIKKFKEGNHYIHATTKNKSFLHLHKTLKKLGIKNNKFFLRIYDPDLIDIDPMRKNLSLKNQAKVLTEIKKNPWYFIREIFQIPVAGGVSRYRLEIGNLAIIWAILQNYNLIAEMPRQTGKTWAVLAIYSWIFNFGTNNSQIIFANKELTDSKENLKRLKEAKDLYPEYLKIKHKNDATAIEHLKLGSNKNEIKTVTAPNSGVNADKLGRGLTTPLIWWDEFAFLKFNKVIHSAAAPAFKTASKSAKENNKPYGKHITTTPNNLDVPEGLECFTLIERSAEFIEEMYDWKTEEINRYIAENSFNDFIHIKYTWQQLGKSEEWYQEQSRNLDDPIKLKREVDLEWSLSSDLNPFEEEDLENLKKYIKKPIKKILINKTYSIDVLDKSFSAENQYVIGCDMSGGLDQDSSTMVISDPKTLQPVAIFGSNKISVPKFRNLLYIIMTQIIPNSFLVIERNSYGLTIMQDFRENSEYSKVMKRVFYLYKEDEKIIQNGEKKISMKNSTKKNKTIKYGIDTVPASRNMMMDLLFEKVKNNPEIFVSEKIFNEIKNLQYTTRGKIEHAIGQHDDHLFGWLVSFYASCQTTWRRFVKTDFNKKMAKRSNKFLGIVQTNNPNLSDDSKKIMDYLNNESIRKIKSKVIQEILKK